MKVCIVTTAFPRWLDDNHGPFVHGAALALMQKGLDVLVITMHSPGVKTRETWNGIEIIRPKYLPTRMEVLRQVTAGIPHIWENRPFARLAILPFMAVHTFATARYAKNYDIVHANWTLSGTSALISQFWHRSPYIVTVQGSDIFRTTHLPFVRQITKLVLNRAACVIAISQALSEALIDLGITANKIEIIPNGVDTNFVRPPASEREHLLLFVGSLIKRKGVRYLIQAMPQVLQKIPDIRLAIIGEGPQQEELVRLSSELEISDKVQFIGSQNQTQVREWMQRAKLLILPSIEEGLGVVLLEALACGTPCVASNVGGISDVVSQDVGLLVPPAKPFALADAITSMLMKQDQWEKYSQRARERALQEFSWDIVSNRILQIYKEILPINSL